MKKHRNDSSLYMHCVKGEVAEQTIDEGKTIKIYFRKMNKNLPTRDLPSVKVAKITSDVAKITVLTTSNKYSNILCTSSLEGTLYLCLETINMGEMLQL